MITTIIVAGVGGAFLAILCMALFKSSKQPLPGSKHSYPAILVIDDNTSVLNMVRMALENEGYKVYAAFNPQEGIELFKQYSATISLVLLDFRMPEMCGDRVFDCLQKINADVPVLLMTGFYEDTQEAKKLLNDVRGYLIKPFHLGNLIAKVREVVSAQ
ncbi:MAG: response regulator [Verrucomicrobia bacterium]|nr:response regulator [Verrucomicrobiota bacterium]